MLTTTYLPDSLPTNLVTVDEFEAWERDHPHEGSYEFVRGQIIDRGGVPQRHIGFYAFLIRLFYQTTAYQSGGSLTMRLDSYVDQTRLRVPDLSYYDSEQVAAMRLN